MEPLDSIEKRDLLAAAKFSPEAVREHAQDFFARGQYGDAFEFFRKLHDMNGVRQVKDAVIEAGDPEILWRIERAYPQEIGKEDWGQCGRNAMQAGKFRSAAYIFERIGDAESLAAAEKEFKPAAEAPPDPEQPVAK